MNKLILTLSFLLLLTAGFAQGKKPRAGKKNPTLTKLNTVVKIEDHQQLFKSQLAMSNDEELKLAKIKYDNLGFTHHKFQQYYRGVKVDGCTYTAHEKNGIIKHTSGNFRAIDDINMGLTISGQEAFKAALDYVDAKEYAWDENSSLGTVEGLDRPKGELVIITDLAGKAPARLAYKFDIYAAKPVYRADVYIDAHTGEFIKQHEKICTADVNATGNARYNGNVNFKADSYNGAYRLRQSTNDVQTFTLNSSTNYNNAQDITSSNTNFTNNSTAVQAHWGAENTHRYYLQNHGRNSFNGNGATIKSYVSYDYNYVNAFWDGSRMTYGDGDGTSYGPLVSLDIVGHEITHGVVQYTADLVYSYESGALNESFADIFGESIENFALGSNDWYMGADIGIGGNGAFRSMSNPNAFGHPDTYQGDSWHTNSSDNGGVHINSGVQNKWFYILTTGESGTNDNGDSYSVTGIGMTKAGAIAYRNLATYLSANSQYTNARAGAIQAAIDLYGEGSPEVIATTDAWYAVGVGAAYDGGSGGGGGGGGECATDGAMTLSITLDNYPIETTWSVTSGGTTLYSGGGYSTANTTVTESMDLPEGDYTFTINDSYGDGICCSYGNGSYTLSSGGTSLASGGSFTSSESTNFCIESGGDTQAPSTPLNLSASGTTQTGTSLSWNASTDNVGVTGYNVYQGVTLINSTSNTSLNISGLSANSTYTFNVTAMDAAENESGASNTVTVTTSGGDTQAPSTPQNLTAFGTTETQTTLSWNASTDNVGVRAYNIYQEGAYIGDISNTSTNITGLSANSTYTFNVTAIDAAGNESGASNTVTITTSGGSGGGGGGECATDGAITLSITLDNYPRETTWSVTSGGTTLYSGSGYSTANTTVTESMDLSSGDYTFIINDSYGDGICCSYGNGSYTLSGGSTTLASGGSFTSSESTTFCVEDGGDTQAPSVPLNLRASGTTETETNLFWNASSDNVGVTAYNIYYAGSSIGSVNEPSSSIIGMAPGNSYSFHVTAVDAAGNESGVSNTVTVNTSNGNNCPGGAMTLTILLDNYPSETTWIITNGGTTLASGGSYTTANTTITESMNLPAGDHTFTIYDAYGDGICCGYGNGSYTLSSGGTVIASGGSFTSSEATDFCVSAANIATFGGEATPELGEMISLYPNPTSDFINITGLSDDVQSMSIYSVSGARIREVETSTTSDKINVEILEPGIYFLSIQTKNGGKTTKKFIKQ